MPDSCTLETITQGLTSAPVQFDQAVRLAAPCEEVFACIVDFERLQEWMPLIRSVAVDDTQARVAGQVGCVRVISPLAGPAVRETVRVFEPPSTLAYSASDASLRGAFTDHVSILLCSRDGAGTRLHWRVCAQPARNPIIRPAARCVFGAVLRRSLRNLERRFGTPAEPGSPNVSGR